MTRRDKFDVRYPNNLIPVSTDFVKKKKKVNDLRSSKSSVRSVCLFGETYAIIN